ncbi:MAG TPA: dihydropyrimidinase [Candidatus Krumholzibacteria bacterium]|nr:dihydropyrimidinase [Candidatus Krumholzibacteria bacterium]
MDRWLITGAALMTGDGERKGALRTAGGRIAEVLPADLGDEDADALAARHGATRVDGTGLVLVPGAVDPHVHFALPAGGTVTVDDFVSGSQAALAGGTTTIIDFITPSRKQTLVEASELRLAEAAACACDYALHGTVTSWRRDTPADLAAAADRYGLRSLKLYMAYLDSIGLEERDLAKAMGAAAELDLVVLLHCEDGAMIEGQIRELHEAGRRDPEAHALARTARAEGTAVRTAMALAGRTGARPYVVHISTGAAMAAIAAARADGRTVYAETCPQYLLLDEGAYRCPFEHAAAAVMSPPLRPACQADALRGLLGRGAFDVVATDHCAFNLAGQKDRGRDDFTRIPGGAPGVQERLALLWTLGVATGLITPADWVRLTAENPARIFGLWPRKGSLQPGADADLVLWDPFAERIITQATARSRADHSLWEGRRTVGAPVKVWSRGELVLDGERLDAPAGRGLYLR